MQLAEFGIGLDGNDFPSELAKTRAHGKIVRPRRADLARELDDAERLPTGLSLRLPTLRAHLHERQGRHEAAWADKESVVLSCERMGDARGVRIALGNLADLALARGDVDEAVRRGRELVAALRSAGLLQSEGGISCANLCAALTQRGELEEARAMAREALPSLQRRAQVHWFLDHIALLAFKRGRHADAARALGRSDALALQDEDRRDVNEQRAHDQVELERERRNLARLQELAAIAAEQASRTARENAEEARELYEQNLEFTQELDTILAGLNAPTSGPGAAGGRPSSPLPTAFA